MRQYGSIIGADFWETGEFLSQNHHIEHIEIEWPSSVACRTIAVNSRAADDMLAQLPPGGRGRFEAYTHAQARRQAIASEWIKQVWLPAELGADVLEWQIGPHGKPVLGGALAHMGVNISHSGDWVVLALALNARVGVDIQIRRSRVRIQPVSALIFSESEQRLVPADDSTAFFQLWSQKEALLKALGRGLSDSSFRQQTQLVLSDFQTEAATGAQVAFQWLFDGAYALSVALLKANGPDFSAVPNG